MLSHYAGFLARAWAGCLLCGALAACAGKKNAAPEERMSGAQSSGDTSAVAGEMQVDTLRLGRAVLVLRAQLVQAGIGSKFLWDSVRVLRVIKNASGRPVPNTMTVARYSWEPGVPERPCTVYLEAYGDGATGRWQLLNGSAKLGVSHIEP